MTTLRRFKCVPSFQWVVKYSDIHAIVKLNLRISGALVGFHSEIIDRYRNRNAL